MTHDSHAAVLRGSNLLDTHVPDWYWAINLDTLNQNDMDSCVVGQLFGDWTVGLMRMGLDERDWDDVVYRGFSGNSPFKHRDDPTPTLTNAWRALIEGRRAEETRVLEESKATSAETPTLTLTVEELKMMLAFMGEDNHMLKSYTMELDGFDVTVTR